MQLYSLLVNFSVKHMSVLFVVDNSKNRSYELGVFSWCCHFLIGSEDFSPWLHLIELANFAFKFSLHN